MTTLEYPFARFQEMFDHAVGAGVAMPEAMSLATVDAAGNPSVRMVLCKGVDARGFVFYTNFESRKGVEALGQPRAALCFHWVSLEQQVRVEGGVEVVSDEEADAYFATRPRGSQLGAWASKQSRPMRSREELEKAFAEVTERFGAGPVSRPPFWSGMRVVPTRVEFWQGRPDRLHDRTLYVREGDGWRVEMLQP